ncbi:hypothetical protein WR25_27180 [Diploscapter pachys]|uniref:Uncharacterized protein n=1 Tax=Diploscapter pachys TaxID=2018661 RepID=A0A2A2KFD5_9BILA|nr:hypothetical protein WR25_27180 [Diploscapter pachys]
MPPATMASGFASIASAVRRAASLAACLASSSRSCTSALMPAVASATRSWVWVSVMGLSFAWMRGERGSVLGAEAGFVVAFEAMRLVLLAEQAGEAMAGEEQAGDGRHSGDRAGIAHRRVEAGLGRGLPLVGDVARRLLGEIARVEADLQLAQRARQALARRGGFRFGVEQAGGGIGHSCFSVAGARRLLPMRARLAAIASTAITTASVARPGPNSVASALTRSPIRAFTTATSALASPRASSTSWLTRSVIPSSPAPTVSPAVSIVGKTATSPLRLVVEAGLDDPGEREAQRRGDADRDAWALADEGTCVIEQFVDVLVADLAGEVGDDTGCRAGVVAILRAELVVDLAGGVLDHLRQLVEAADRALLAGVGQRADLVGRLGAVFRRIILGGLLRLFDSAGRAIGIAAGGGG